MSFGLIRVFIHTLVIAIKKNVCSFTLNTFDWIFPVASIRGKSSLIKQNNGVRCLLVCVYSEICCCASIDTMPYWRPGASKKLYGKLNSNIHMNNDDDAICMNAFSQFFFLQKLAISVLHHSAPKMNDRVICGDSQYFWFNFTTHRNNLLQNGHSSMETLKKMYKNIQ